MKNLRQQEKGAVLYIRVSTTEQAEGPLNLINQKQRCQDYCTQKKLPVLAVFTDPGESARTADRPQFQEMLRFCRAHRNQVGFVVVQDLSRFARNLRDMTDTIESLFRIGVLVRSVYEGNVDETASGKLSAHFLGGINEYFSNSLSEKQRDNTRKLVAAGLFPWRAPIGYKNVVNTGYGNISPDPQRAPFISRAFELIEGGQHKKSEVLKTLSDEGLRTVSGKPVTKQTFQAILRNPLYAGWVRIPSDQRFDPVRGLHQPLVEQKIFDRVQAILDGRRPTIAPKLRVNPAVPLRSLIKCGACGTPITGGSPVGRGGKKYPRYWCPNSDCLAVKLPKAQFEAEFMEVLAGLRAAPQTLLDFRKLAPKVWERREGYARREMAKITGQLEEHRRLKMELLKMRMRGEITAEDFEDAKAEHAVGTYDLEERMRSLDSQQATADAFARFAELQLVNIPNLWMLADPDQKARVQRLLFGAGLEYVPGTGILNRSNSNLFSYLQVSGAEGDWLVGPPGLEPGTNGL